MPATSLAISSRQESNHAGELSLRDHSYRPGTSICFVTSGAKRREVFAADFQDRVVHHLLVSRVEPLFERRFIHDSFACQGRAGMAMRRADVPAGPTSQAQFFRWVSRRPWRDSNHYEFIRGRIVVSPPAGYPHGLVETRLVIPLGVHVAELGLGRIFGSSQGYDLPSGDTLEPDAAFISNARWKAGPAPVAGKFLRIVPDLAVEILSRSTARRDRGVKLDSYRENGVREYWIVDPVERSVAVIDLEGGGPREGTTAVGGRIPSLVLPRLRLDVSRRSSPTDAPPSAPTAANCPPRGSLRAG